MGTVVNEGANWDREVDGRAIHEELPEKVGDSVRKTHVVPRKITVCCPTETVHFLYD
jgi:hypothetical protein